MDKFPETIIYYTRHPKNDSRRISQFNVSIKDGEVIHEYSEVLALWINASLKVLNYSWADFE